MVCRGGGRRPLQRSPGLPPRVDVTTYHQALEAFHEREHRRTGMKADRRDDVETLEAVGG